MTLAAVYFLAAVVTVDATDRGRFDGLRIDARRAGRLLAAGGQAHLTPLGIHQALPRAVVTPALEIIVGGALGLQVMGQHIPLATGTVLVEQRIEHLAHIDGAWRSTGFGRWDQGFQNGPLVIREVSWVSLTHGSCHSAARVV